jgi:hypothetical protein
MWNRTLFAAPKIFSSFQRKVQISALRQLSMPSLVIGSISNSQMHNLLEYEKTSQLTEAGISDALSKGLLSIFSMHQPLVNLLVQICTIEATS